MVVFHKQPASEVFSNLRLKIREMEELRAWSESDDISVKNNKHIYLEITAETTML